MPMMPPSMSPARAKTFHPNHTRFSMNSYNSGLFAEFWAKMYLRLHGFRIVQSRYITGRNTGRAEIDIIARRRNLMIFIEVKRRPDIKTAWAAITPAQGVRLRRAAENFIVRNGWRGDTRFDAILVCRWRIYWARGAL
jgi:putative endonuclease